MKSLVLSTVIMLCGVVAHAQGFSGEAMFSAEDYDFGTSSQSGIRQSYRVRLDRALTASSLFRLFFQGDDFNDTSDANATGDGFLDTRQMQPGAEVLFDVGAVRLQARSDLFLAQNGRTDNESTFGRTSASLVWTPAGLPEFRVLGFRNTTEDVETGTDLRDQSLVGTAAWSRGNLLVSVSERYGDYTDFGIGYQREASGHVLDGGYTKSYLEGRFAVAVQGSAQLIEGREQALRPDSPVAVPDPVLVGKVSYAIDQTPLDSSDVQFTSMPGLHDNSVNALTTVSIGPEAPSFQNLLIDVGRTDRVDEIRIFARDSKGNPLRTGGGPVTWDVYASQDGVIWTSVPSTASFDEGQSSYRLTFEMIVTRWMKVVSFGANTEASFVTEVQLFVHALLGPDGRRDTTREFYASNLSMIARPNARFEWAYNGGYNATQQSGDETPSISSNGIDHDTYAQFSLSRSTAVRAQYTQRDSEYGTASDYMRRVAGSFDWHPTTQLSTTLEYSSQDQSYEGGDYNIVSQVASARGQVLPALSISLVLGAQTQSEAGEKLADRMFASLNAQAQLTRSLRLLVTGTLQEVNETERSDPASALLGAAQDNRVAAELFWRPGQQLTLSGRLGWNEGREKSGLTQKYHIEWYPFADGTVSLGGTYDEDVDPVFERTSTRAMFNPRWAINDYASLDFNFTRVTFRSESYSQDQQTIFAMLTLRR